MKKKLLIPISAAVIIVVVIAYIAVGASEKPRGYVLPNPINSPNFVLQNAVTGETVELSKLYGKVVAISFVYVHCPDVCPIIFARFKQAANELDKAGFSGQYVMLLISVDPERDIKDGKAYMEKLNAPSEVIFLVGNRTVLQQVWNKYGVYVEKVGTGENYTVTHSVIIILLDKQLRQRIYFGNILSWSPEDLYHDMVLLLKE